MASPTPPPAPTAPASAPATRAAKAPKVISKPASDTKPEKITKPAKGVKKSTEDAAVTKAEKIKKPKLVRDSFTIPKLEYLVIDALKQRAGKLGRAAKKSELLRAGIKVLASMDDAAFVTALKQVPAIKTGRPAKA